ncbi:MAG: hypothetical protein U0528_16315 [Anaerolineae bacterium]
MLIVKGAVMGDIVFRGKDQVEVLSTLPTLDDAPRSSARSSAPRKDWAQPCSTSPRASPDTEHTPTSWKVASRPPMRRNGLHQQQYQ